MKKPNKKKLEKLKKTISRKELTFFSKDGQGSLVVSSRTRADAGAVQEGAMAGL
jgi:hypothetical protein